MKVVELEPENQREELSVRLERIELILKDIREGTSPSLLKRFTNSAVTAFGAVVGAAVLVAIAVAVLRPFQNLEVIGTRIERVLDTIDHSKK